MVGNHTIKTVQDPISNGRDPHTIITVQDPISNGREPHAIKLQRIPLVIVGIHTL